MKRRDLPRGLAVAAAILFSAPAVLQAARADRKPNIVLIMADDLGYECLSCNGSGTYKTPRLDQLAKGHALPLATHLHALAGADNDGHL